MGLPNVSTLLYGLRCCNATDEARLTGLWPQVFRTSWHQNMACIQSFTVPAPVKFALNLPSTTMTTVVVRMQQPMKTA